MPLPTPNKKEKRNDFIGRCIAMLAHKKEGKDNSQRAAICISQWNKSKKAQAKLTLGEIAILEEILNDRKNKEH